MRIYLFPLLLKSECDDARQFLQKVDFELKRQSLTTLMEQWGTPAEKILEFDEKKEEKKEEEKKVEEVKEEKKEEEEKEEEIEEKENKVDESLSRIVAQLESLNLSEEAEDLEEIRRLEKEVREILDSITELQIDE